jgi:coproporphyrinogen III oxidase
MLKQQEIGGKAVAAKLKAANKVGYKWKAKEIRDTGGLFFDAHFGPDWWGGKDKSVEKEKFIRDATDWMEHYRSVINPKTGVLYTLQDIMEQLTKQEEYQY